MLKNVQGIKKFLLYRLLKDAETKAGIKIALQTEHEVTSSRELNTEATKDGAIVAMGAIEQEISATVFLSHSDEIEQFKEAQEQGWLVELWDVIAEEPDENDEYNATYYQAYVSEIGETAPTDEGVEVSITFGVEDYGKRGRTPLTAEQEKVFRYVFVKALAGTTQEKAQAELANEPVVDDGTTSPTQPEVVGTEPVDDGVSELETPF